MAEIAVIGTGLIGRSWAVVFARAGYEVTLWDGADGAAEAAVRHIGEALGDLEARSLLSGAAMVSARVRTAASLAAAVTRAVYVQESVAEKVEAKREVFAALDAAAPAEAVLASSTSMIPVSAFTEALAGRRRCLVAHPANPPHLLPVVELVPAPFTEAAAVERARRLMADAGQVPVIVSREVDGFVMNRLQAALVNEAMALVADGVVDPAGLDDVVKHSIGRRWSFMGPFETMDLNAPDGFADYARRYGTAMARLVADRPRGQPWTAEAVETVIAARREALPASALADRQRWRDRRLARLADPRDEP